MMRQSPPELFTQRPVRSDFGRRGEPVVNMRRLFMLIALLGIAVLIGIAVHSFMKDEAPSGEVPTIAADGEVKKRPDDPGGLEVPHQDVQVFQQLEKTATAAASEGVEHLLPPPETPQPQSEAPVAAPSASLAEAEKKAEEELPPPITSDEPIKTAEKLIENAKPVADAKKTVEEKKAEASPIVAAEPAKMDSNAKVEAKKAEEKAAAKIEAVKAEAKAKAAPVKTAKKKAEDAKVEAAMARLPAELFTTGEVPKEQPKTVEATAPAASVSGKVARLQLASFPEEASAQASARKLQAQYAGLLNGASLTIVRADLAKGTYYRVMSQPLPEAKAKEICAALAKEKAACLVAR